MQKFEAEVDASSAKGANGGIPGSLATVVDKTGKIIYQYASGVKGVTPDAQPIDANTTFFMASCTKLITSITILQAVERGILTLDDPIDKHIPELASQPIIQAKEGTDPPFILTPATKPITIRHLLTHSSGFGYDVMHPLLAAWRTSRGQKAGEVHRLDIVNDYGVPRLFESGEGYIYGPSLDFAGLVLGRVTGSSLGQWCTENVFKPLGMESTTFRLLENPGFNERLMRMSTRKGDGTLEDGPEQVFAIDPVDEAGGVGSYSCAWDYTRVLADLMKASPTLLTKESVDLLFTPQFADGSASFKALQAAKGFGVFDGWLGLPLSEGADLQYNHGLGGLVIVEDIQSEKYFKPKGTLTWGGMPNLLWAVNREKGIGLLFATHVLPWGDVETQRLWKVFENEVWRNFG